MHRVGQGRAADVPSTVSGVASDWPLLRHQPFQGGTRVGRHTAQGTEKARRQKPPGGGATIGKQDIPRTGKPAQGKGSPHISQNHSELHLRTSKNSSAARPPG